MHRWNHVNYAVPPERVPLVEACFDAIFPWEKFVAKPYLLGYRFATDFDEGALYVRPVPAGGELTEALGRLRAHDAALDAALARLETIEADWADHTGFLVGSVPEWEERLATIERTARERPDFELRVVDVLRPGDGRAQTDYLHQAFIRVGLLGPFRNTFEMQARQVWWGLPAGCRALGRRRATQGCSAGSGTSRRPPTISAHTSYPPPSTSSPRARSARLTRTAGASRSR